MATDANAQHPPIPLELTGMAEWLVERGLQGWPVGDLIEAFCKRVVESGFPARRFAVSIGMLHPRHGARSYVWHSGGFAAQEFPRQRSGEELEPYRLSPIYYLRKSGGGKLRRRLVTGAPYDFPVLAELSELGMTDYAAQLLRFEEPQSLSQPSASGAQGRPDLLQGLFFSCSTDVPGGFSDWHLGQSAIWCRTSHLR